MWHHGSWAISPNSRPITVMESNGNTFNPNWSIGLICSLQLYRVCCAIRAFVAEIDAPTMFTVSAQCAVRWMASGHCVRRTTATQYTSVWHVYIVQAHTHTRFECLLNYYRHHHLSEMLCCRLSIAKVCILLDTNDVVFATTLCQSNRSFGRMPACHPRVYVCLSLMSRMRILHTTHTVQRHKHTRSSLLPACDMTV